MMNILYSMMLCVSMMFLQMNHPLAMGLMLMTQTILICMTTGLLTKTFWFSYILFLIFVGGMLVLFIYVTSLASNEMFSLSMKSMMIIMVTFIIMMFMLWYNDKNMINMMFYNSEMNSLSNNMMLYETKAIELNKLYNFPTNTLTIMLINYLLITLIVVVKITKLFYGPIRMMF